MKKKKTNNIGVMIIALIIILLGVVGVYLLKDNKDNLKTNNNSTNQTNTPNNFDETTEREDLNTNLKKMEFSLGFIAVLTSIDKYNAGGDYITKKNVNLLKDTASKQLFVIEQIVSNEDAHKNFIILDMNGEVDNEGSTPTMDGATAYYPYNLFKEEYQKYFPESFNIEERKISTFNNNYDKNTNYIYYENRRPGLNGLSVTGITIENIEKTENNQYKANITLNYNERLSELLGVDSEQAELIYQKQSNSIQIISYILK